MKKYHQFGLALKKFKESQKRYQLSEKGIATRRKHQQTEGRKKRQKQSQQKYRQTGKYICSRQKYEKKNRERIQKYAINKYHNDIQYKIRINLSVRILQAIKTGHKSISMNELIGCSIPELLSYLEKQFVDGMSWKNHTKNGWHIDHMKPCKSFNLTNIEQQKKCFNYTNLQPLWAKENQKKSSKDI